MNRKQEYINQILWHLGRMVNQQYGSDSRNFLASVNAIEDCCKRLQRELQPQRIIVDECDDDEL